jgi:hypothetical protein
MSDTPKTDAMMTALLWRTGETLIADVEFAHFARELERENAALRKENRKAHDMACEDAVERYRLNGENAALRSLVHDMAAEMEQHGGEQAFDSLARYRAALAKEAKP